MTRPLSLSISVLAIGAGLFAIPAAAQDVIRPGDSTMTCEAMAREINSLSRDQARAAQRAQARANGNGGGFGAFARSLSGAARPMLDTVVSNTGGDTMAAAVIARSAIDGAQNGQRNSAPSARPSRPVAPAAPAPTVDSMRLERLNSLHTQRGC